MLHNVQDARDALSYSEEYAVAWTLPGQSKKMPLPRFHHACCLTDSNEIILHGGWTGVKLVLF